MAVYIKSLVIASALLTVQIANAFLQPETPPTYNRCLRDKDLRAQVKDKLVVSEPPRRSSLPLPKGPYEVKTGTIASMPGLSQGGPYGGAVVYAVPRATGEKFPFISFAHGTGAGYDLPGAYATDLELVASYGFVIVAAKSCPTTHCNAGYCVDQQATIRACAKDPSLHPALASADFSTVGIYGHSMGAMATIGSLGGATMCQHDQSLNIKAAVSQHTCSGSLMNASSITTPIMFTSGSVDRICEDGCAKLYFDEVQRSPSKIMFDVQGANHFEPTENRAMGGGSNSEVPAVAYFLACWLRNENCDKVYGASGNAICDQIPAGASLHACTVVGTKDNDHLVV